MTRTASRSPRNASRRSWKWVFRKIARNGFEMRLIQLMDPISPSARRLSTPPHRANSTCATLRWRRRRRASTGSAPEVIQTALTSFEGIARRQEVRGKVRGVTVIDDFGHHPTAIRETLSALRHRYPGQRLWAIFEPRSNTTRRAVFQRAAAGGAQARRRRLHRTDRGPRADPGGSTARSAKQSSQAIEAAGRPAFYERDAAAIVERITPLLQPNDVVTVFSNGGFDGIHGKLLAKLAAPSHRSSGDQTIHGEQVRLPKHTACTFRRCDPARSATLPAACERGG